MTELRDHLQLVCRSNEALGDARWKDMEGVANHGILSYAWFQWDSSEYRACSSSLNLGFITIVCNKSTQVAMNRVRRKVEKIKAPWPDFSSNLTRSCIA